MTIVGTYVLEREPNDIDVIRQRMVFEVLDKPEPNVVICYYRDGIDFSRFIARAEGRDLHTLKQGREIWDIHVAVGYRRVKG
jgi:hypothetical protein